MQAKLKTFLIDITKTQIQLLNIKSHIHLWKTFVFSHLTYGCTTLVHQRWSGFLRFIGRKSLRVALNLNATTSSEKVLWASGIWTPELCVQYHFVRVVQRLLRSSWMFGERSSCVSLFPRKTWLFSAGLRRKFKSHGQYVRFSQFQALWVPCEQYVTLLLGQALVWNHEHDSVCQVWEVQSRKGLSEVWSSGFSPASSWYLWDQQRTKEELEGSPACGEGWITL